MVTRGRSRAVVCALRTAVVGTKAELILFDLPPQPEYDSDVWSEIGYRREEFYGIGSNPSSAFRSPPGVLPSTS